MPQLLSVNRNQNLNCVVLFVALCLILFYRFGRAFNKRSGIWMLKATRKALFKLEYDKFGGYDE